MRKFLGVLVSLLVAVGLVFTIASCVSAGNGVSMKDGVYVADAQGHNGPVTVQTTILGGKITKVAVLKHNETAGVFEAALDRLPVQIVKEQTLALDAVTGATYMSDAILEGVEKCIKAAGGSVEAWKTKKAAAINPSTETYDCDVVVVGAGGSGSSAAVTAAEGGAKVIVVEKAAQPGGTSIMASGILATDSALQKKAGVVCHTEDLYASWQSYNAWLNDSVLTWKYFEKSASTVDWLEAHGFSFKLIPNVQKTHVDGFETYHHYGKDEERLSYMKTLLSSLDKHNGQVMYETRATSIIMKNGRAAGIEAKKVDGTKVIINSRAVVIASGGFGANPEIVSKVSHGVKMSALNSGMQTGDGLTMARAVGAGGEGREFLQYHGVDMPFEIMGAAATSGDGSKGAALGGIGSVNHFANFPGALWVSSKGQRFASESICYDSALVANATYAVGGDYYVIVDSKTVATLETKGSSGLGINMSPERLVGEELAPVKAPWTNLTVQFDQAIKLKGAFKGDTIADLAKAMNMDPETLTATVNSYNKVCEMKKDRQFGKDPMYLISITKGPFYAVLGRTVQLGGLGGISTDSDLRVTDTHRNIIPGLYAAGNDVNQIYNNVYPLIEGGTAGWAFNSGRIAGETVLKDLTK